MFTAASLLTIVFYVRAKRNVYLYLILYGFSLFCFSFAIDGNFLGLWDYMYVYGSVENSILIILYWVILYFAYFMFFFTISNKVPCLYFPSTNVRHIRIAARVLGFLSLSACAYNVSRVSDLYLMISSPRLWEAQFGQSVITNYVYFLHLPALVLFGIIFGIRCGRGVDFVLVLALLASSVFHGIKFTILHAFLFYSFSFLLMRAEKITGMVYALASLLMMLLVGFFVLFRGGGVQGLLDYIFSASVNSMYIINEFNFYDISSYKIFNPFSFIPFGRLESRLIEGGAFDASNSAGFYLNDSYNLQHVVTKLGFAFGSGLFLYTIFFALLINYLRSAFFYQFHKIYFLVMVMSSLLLFFTAFDFYKTKLWFGLFVLCFIYFLCNKRLVKH